LKEVKNTKAKAVLKQSRQLKSTDFTAKTHQPKRAKKSVQKDNIIKEK
jgi:hypothetical protein